MDAGVHFHMCALLSKLQRWSKVKTYLQEHENIVVNFSEHPGYHTAYQYVIKEDSQALTPSYISWPWQKRKRQQAVSCRIE